ncbi:AAA family ATPase [Candidatus Fermentibacteria bacterium]|nr:AAA family ATPase [Candidatus Fermentibacteria bacterium]
MNSEPLIPEELRWTCPETRFDFEKTSDIEPTDKIVGQERAQRAVRLGLEIPSIGYNMFVTGVSGTGRETTVKRILDAIDTTAEDLKDICYVHNMEDSRHPLALEFKAGAGKRFVSDVNECIELLKTNIPAVLNSERMALEKRSLVSEFEQIKKEVMQHLEEEAKKHGFGIVNVPIAPGKFRPDVLPVMEDKPVSFDKLEKMVQAGEITEEKLEEYRKIHERLFGKLAEAYRETKKIDVDLQNRLRELHRRIVEPTIDGILSRLKEGYDRKVQEYVDAMRKAILENLEAFLEVSEESNPYTIFSPNLIVNNADRETKPIIMEQFPDHVSLFGTIDRVIVDNRAYSDHTMIRAGSILKANGGYLILEALDVVRQPLLWQTLIQTLRNQTVVMRPHDPLSLLPVKIQPEAVSINVKVVMIGSSYLYSLLAQHDPEFGLLFRIRADFDDRMPMDEKTLSDFADVIANICHNEKLPPLDRAAMAALAEQAVRITGRRDKLSLEFSRLADFVRQAAHWARSEDGGLVTAENIRKAIEEKRYRLQLPEERAMDLILSGGIMIDTEGTELGQVNGLAVYSTVDYSFGMPVRITAQVSAGREGIIDVEREAELSGAIHTKGIQIIAGYLRGHYAQDYPLSLTASICFEQSYGGIDGDSASSTELYALLSALSGLPVRQGLAVTGSVNQIGELQAIGGVNEKIEGFFKVCSKRGLTGEQGVMIPVANKHNLQLSFEVLDAVKEGKFHVYSIATIDEGIGLLTEKPAGDLLPDGSYPTDTVNGLVDRRLRHMAETLKSFKYSG